MRITSIHKGFIMPIKGSNGAGALLRDGGFRADVAQVDVAALRIVARQRYLSWMQRR